MRLAEKSWGDFTVLDENKGSITIKIQLSRVHQLKYHSHEHRSEVWTVTRGKAEAIINGRTINMEPDDSLNLPIGSKHIIRAI